ncbi:hypothetical protein Pan97_07180 [Bremerella volcania]|uniref:RNA polymerase sigma factor n=1 Tax=Bremerella volcania TaxID=2527984 RepID=A0A518C3C2_9BACT|nr:sigma-70 family RNA polymerase sigma factor [Bremerella volcania]QDU73719.1 hypothetical protein Pan97_07180 [Bremerella volcania]
MTLDKEDLKHRFLAAIDYGWQWEKVWHLLISHPWYQITLQTQAQNVLRKQRLPINWHEDVQQDAMLLLARSLRHRADLRVDLDQVHECFAGWMARIIARDCQEAVRQMRRQFMREQSMPDIVPLEMDRLPLDAKIDISLKIQQLNDPERTILTLWSEGFSVTDIANRLALSYQRTYYLWRRGTRQLRALLGASYLAVHVS